MSYFSLAGSRPICSRSFPARLFASALTTVASAADVRRHSPLSSARSPSPRLAPPALRRRHTATLAPPPLAPAPLSAARVPPHRRCPPARRSVRQPRNHAATICRARNRATAALLRPCAASHYRPHATTGRRPHTHLHAITRASPTPPCNAARLALPLRHRVDVTAVSPRLVTICDRDGP
jgi:hypothetical protein